MKQVQYKDDIIEYEIIRKEIKNVYISVKQGAVIVTAPKAIKDEEIEKIITKKAHWIYTKLKEGSVKQERKDLYTEEEFISITGKIARGLIQETGLKPNRIRVRDIKYAWGSCSRNRNITININLMQYSEDAIRYVILHELCHLKYMNHSKDFWNLVFTYMPNYKEVRKELK